MADSQTSNASHFLDYWRVIRNRAPIILTIFMLTFVTGYVITYYYLVNRYKATAQILIAESDRTLAIYGNDRAVYDNRTERRALEVLRSTKVLYPVIEKLNLRKRWAQEYYESNEPISKQSAYGILRGSIDVEQVYGSDLVEITAESLKPDEAAELANALAELYIEVRRQDNLEETNRGFLSLDAEIEIKEKELEAARARVEEIRQAGDGIDTPGSLDSESHLIDEEFKRTNELLESAESDLTARRIRFEELNELPQDRFLDALEAMGISQGNVGTLRTRQLGLESALENLTNSGLGTDHPRIQAVEAELDAINRQLDNIVEGRRKALEIDLRIASERVQKYETRVEDMRKQVREIRTNVMIPLREATTEMGRIQLIVNSLKVQRAQQSVKREIGDEPVKFLSRAEPPGGPFSPKRTLNLMVSGLLGLILGIVIAFFIEYLDTSVKTMDDVEKFLELPVLSVIPDGVAPLIQEGPDSPHAEGYRILRAKIDLSPSSGAGNALTILSGGPGEGKSTTLFNLAYVAAQSGQSVLVVDCDLRRPVLHSIVGLENTAGTADVFLGRGEAHQYIQPTTVPNLHVITAGDMPSAEMGAFSGSRLREMLADLKLRYDLVLIDGPPVLGISDGSVIAHEVDACLLVIQHRRYPRDISLRAKRAVEEVKGNLLGVVLNAVTIRSDEAYYYYSSYGSYYSTGQAKQKDRSAAKPKTRGAVVAQNHTASHDSEQF